ncbi:TPA: ethanolamine utilization protein EutH [Pseudomonas putida]|nr:ethanolamine utilization protein EutH [Pseudomonas putida]
MQDLGNYVIYIIMFFVGLGALAAIRDDRQGLGAEFVAGIHTIGQLFIPIAGVMASVPFLTVLIEKTAGPIFGALGADPAMAATSVLSVDMGGYQLTHALATSNESWIMASINGFLLGPHVVFTIPVALALLPKSEHKYLALGMMAGMISIPVGLLAVVFFINEMEAPIRSEISTTAPADYILHFDFGTVATNLAPLVIVVLLLAAGLRFVPDLMVKGFMAFGRCADAAMKAVLALSIIQYSTGVFTTVLGHWGFDPIIADAKDQFRALEICGYIALMLSGAFPMVYCIQKYLSRPLAVAGSKLGLSALGSAGIVATTANPLALFRLIPDMSPRDKVMTIAYTCCGAWILGDSLAFIANFQPTLIVPLMLGKIVGAVAGLGLAMWLSVPRAEQLGREEQELGTQPAIIASN